MLIKKKKKKIYKLKFIIIINYKCISSFFKHKNTSL